VLCDILLLICAYSQGKAKKGRLPRVPRQGHSGKFFLRKGTHSSASAWEGALGEEVFKKQLSSPSVALEEEDFF
jgi:hypothetical protein